MDINPYTVTEGFYIANMNYGDTGDGYKLISSDTVEGPFETIDNAKEKLINLYDEAGEFSHLLYQIQVDPQSQLFLIPYSIQ